MIVTPTRIQRLKRQYYIRYFFIICLKEEHRRTHLHSNGCNIIAKSIGYCLWVNCFGIINIKCIRNSTFIVCTTDQVVKFFPDISNKLLAFLIHGIVIFVYTTSFKCLRTFLYRVNYILPERVWSFPICFMYCLSRVMDFLTDLVSSRPHV